jgi:hypothetical protein
MKLDLGYSEFLDLDPLFNGTFDIKNWKDYLLDKSISFEDSLFKKKRLADSSWMKNVFKSKSYKVSDQRIFSLPSQRQVVIFSTTKDLTKNPLLLFLDLWGSAFEYLSFQFEWDLDFQFDPVFLESETQVSLLLLLNSSSRKKPKELHPSEWEFLDSDQAQLLSQVKSSSPVGITFVLNQVETLLTFLRSSLFKKQLFFITSKSPLIFIENGIQSGWFLGFYFDSLVTHEDLNWNCYYHIYSTKKFDFNNQLSRYLGFSIVDQAICYRSHKWLYV